MKVPKQLWQTWRHHYPPAPLQQLIQSFQKLNPGWDKHFFTDRDIANFVEQDFPHLSDLISFYPGGVYLSDIWRCLILYRHGGIYSDIDVECIRPLDELIGAAEEAKLAGPGTEILLSRDHPVHERQHFRGRAMYMNFFMIAQPGARFFGYYLERLEKLAADHPNGLKRRGPVALTGPGAFAEIVEEAGGPAQVGIGLLPWEWVSPLPDMAIPGNFPGKKGYDELIKAGDWAQKLNPFVSHYWWHSYSRPRNTIANYGPTLFQTDGMIASRSLEGIVPEGDDHAYVAGRALAEFAELKQRILVNLSEPRPGSVLPRLARSALEHIEHTSLTQLPGDGAQVGLLHIEGRGEDTLPTLERVLCQNLIASGGLLHISSTDDGTYDRILALASSRRFEILETGPSLLLRAPVQVVIPKVIHQTWKGREVPDIFKEEWIASWMSHNSPNGWTYRFWTDDDINALIDENFPDFADCYFDYDHHIKRVNAAQYLILKRHGGLYADLDFACLRPFDDILAGNRLLFGTEFEDPFQREDCVGNALMASIPDHPFWNGIEHELRLHARDEVLSATGSRFLGRRVKNAACFLDGANLPTILRREIIYPIRWDNPARDKARSTSLSELAERYANSYAITFWTGSWL